MYINKDARKVKEIMGNNKVKECIQIPWKTAYILLESALRKKYKAKGRITFMKDYHYDGIGKMYDLPSFVNIELT